MSVGAFLFSLGLIFSPVLTHAYKVTCDCYACVGEDCLKLPELKNHGLCRGPGSYCGRQLGYFKITQVTVNSQSSSYDEVLGLLESQCAAQETLVFTPIPIEAFAIEEASCIQKF